MKNNTLQDGDRVEVYRNLHKNCFSIRKNGRVVDYRYDDEMLTLVDVKFAVQPAGRAKVLREQKKNVHAFIRGTVSFKTPVAYQELVSYNPYKGDTFFVTFGGLQNPIHKARRVTLSDGKVWANQ
jgi:hypothetical protein